MRVALGSTSPSKLAALRQVIERAFPGSEVVAAGVPSGVSAQPGSADETIRGALNRARAALRAADADLGVGIEGGLETRPEGAFLSAWCAVVDRRGAVGLGSGMRIRLPGEIVSRVRAGEPLGAVIDALTGVEEARESLGAIGVLTRGLVTREAALAHAVAAALAPFLGRAGPAPAR